MNQYTSRRQKHYSFGRNIKGFSLLELMVVVIIIGIFLILYALFGGSPADAARARMIERHAQVTSSNFNMLAQICGTSTTVSGNPLPATGKSVLDILYAGGDNVAAKYQGCYAQSAMKSMRDSMSRSGGTWQLEGTFPVTLTGGGTAALMIQYGAVPDNVVLLLAQRFDTSIQALSASDTTSDVLRYGSSTNGVRTVSFVLK